MSQDTRNKINKLRYAPLKEFLYFILAIEIIAVIVILIINWNYFLMIRDINLLLSGL